MLHRGNTSNIHICLSRCRDNGRCPNVPKWFCFAFVLFLGPFLLLGRTDKKSHSMTCAAQCWGEGRGRGISGRSPWSRVVCGLLHTATVLLCRWLNRFAYLSCVVLCSHCIIVQRVKAFIVMDGLLRIFGLLWAALETSVDSISYWIMRWGKTPDGQIYTYTDIMVQSHFTLHLLLSSLRLWVCCILKVGTVWRSERLHVSCCVHINPDKLSQTEHVLLYDNLFNHFSWTPTSKCFSLLVQSKLISRLLKKVSWLEGLYKISLLMPDLLFFLSSP